MTSAILNVTFDCSDSAAIAGFWAAVTGWPLHEEHLDPGHAEYSVGPPSDGDIRLYFVTVPEPKNAKNRVHLDVVPRSISQAEEIRRLTALGAVVSDSQPPGAGWVVMADPEGNEFCLEPD
jgi:catechol 2,3-dioxygenase-like lactoylglutathione lyase family enzyme